jgi:hypothetical protein
MRIYIPLIPILICCACKPRVSPNASNVSTANETCQDPERSVELLKQIKLEEAFDLQSVCHDAEQKYLAATLAFLDSASIESSNIAGFERYGSSLQAAVTQPLKYLNAIVTKTIIHRNAQECESFTASASMTGPTPIDPSPAVRLLELCPAFFPPKQTSPVISAGILLHEARHGEEPGFPHLSCTAGSKIGMASACDGQFALEGDDSGAYSFSVVFAAMQARYNSRLTGDERQSLRNSAESLALSSINRWKPDQMTVYESIIGIEKVTARLHELHPFAANARPIGNLLALDLFSASDSGRSLLIRSNGSRLVRLKDGETFEELDQTAHNRNVSMPVSAIQHLDQDDRRTYVVAANERGELFRFARDKKTSLFHRDPIVIPNSIALRRLASLFDVLNSAKPSQLFALGRDQRVYQVHRDGLKEYPSGFFWNNYFNDIGHDPLHRSLYLLYDHSALYRLQVDDADSRPNKLSVQWPKGFKPERIVVGYQSMAALNGEGQLAVADLKTLQFAVVPSKLKLSSIAFRQVPRFPWIDQSQPSRCDFSSAVVQGWDAGAVGITKGKKLAFDIGDRCQQVPFFANQNICKLAVVTTDLGFSNRFGPKLQLPFAHLRIETCAGQSFQWLPYREPKPM